MKTSLETPDRPRDEDEPGGASSASREEKRGRRLGTRLLVRPRLGTFGHSLSQEASDACKNFAPQSARSRGALPRGPRARSQLLTKLLVA
eukprot:1548761-Pleurochrysis_carterae.AAC.1